MGKRNATIMKESGARKLDRIWTWRCNEIAKETPDIVSRQALTGMVTIGSR